MAKWDYSLSPSKLGLMECPRCLWLTVHKKVERVRGIYPSLPSGMDAVLKTRADSYRPELPPELQGQMPGELWGSAAEIAKLRQWQSGLKCVLQTPYATISLIGALDDLLCEDQRFSPLDFKTRGWPAKDDGSQYYGRAMDCYALMLESNHFEPSGKAYLAYYSPEGRIDLDIQDSAISPMLRFSVQVFELEASPERARQTITQATEILAGPCPVAASTCDYCSFYDRREAVFLNQK